MKKRQSKLFAALYQLAGDLTLTGDARSGADKARMRELLLDVLSDPDSYTAKMVETKHRLAVAKD